jgi:sulfur transfer protein SufE
VFQGSNSTSAEEEIQRAEGDTLYLIIVQLLKRLDSFKEQKLNRAEKVEGQEGESVESAMQL